MAQLARFRFFVAESERERQPSRERAAAEVEHASAFDATVADQRDVRGASADVDEDAAFGPYLLVGACTRKRVRLRHRGSELQVELAHHRLDGVDVGHRRESVENSDLEILAREADGVGDGIAVDADVRDRGMDETSLQLAVAALHLEQVLSLAQGAALHHLKHRRHLACPYAGLRVLARVRDGRRETLDQLTGDADHDLARHRPRHVLRRLERAIAGQDHRFEVRDRTTRHRGGRLRLAPDAQHLAIRSLAADDQDLDQVGADVEHCEMAVVVAPLAEELELGQLNASSRRLKASSAGTVNLPLTSCGRPPPVPKRSLRRVASNCDTRSLDPLMTNLSPATRVTTPDFTRSR